MPEDICYPIQYVPYCLPGMPEQIIYTQLPGQPMFIKPFCVCPTPCQDPCANKRGECKTNGESTSNNGGSRSNGNCSKC